MIAAYVAGGKAGEVPAVMEAMKISAKETFEIGFNTACGLADVGKFSEAETCLLFALTQGVCKLCSVL